LKWAIEIIKIAIEVNRIGMRRYVIFDIIEEFCSQYDLTTFD
jgi:F420-0:gamma-glutamyl ligase-like protein